jgi:citrate lyase subunit beta/citryl-CoA lyase
MTEPCSLLFVPADTDRFLAKAGQRGADALILDMEDAVAPPAKAAARANLAAFVPLLKADRGRAHLRAREQRARFAGGGPRGSDRRRR